MATANVEAATPRERALAAELVATRAQLHSLLEASVAVVSSLTLHDVLQTVLDGVRSLFRAPAAAVWRRDESGTLRRLASSGLSRSFARETGQRPPDEGVTARVVQLGQPLAVADTAHHPRLAPGGRLEAEGLRALLSAPLFTEGQAIGALNVYLAEPHVFTTSEIGLLVGFANQAAAAIEQALERARTKRALAEVSRQKEVLDAIVRHAEDGIIALDSAGAIVLFSPSCERLTGRRARDVIGHPLHATLGCHGEDGRCPLGEALASATTNAYVETRLTGPVALERWFGATIARARGGPAQEVRSVIVLRDITAARELVRVKSGLLSTVSHELRTPLTSIRALSELLADHEFARAEVQTLASTINREAERLGRLVQNVLDAARIEAGALPFAPRQVQLTSLLEEALAIPRHLDPERPFVLDIPADLPPVTTDPDRLRQALDNLLVNAVKFSPPASPIVVRAQRAGTSIRLSVTDAGPGIPVEQQPLLFRRFGRAASAAPGGVGLGLYLTRELVTLMRGHVGVESSAGDGTTFWITLPLDQT